ncbi:MAG: hypothetical protein JSW11_17860 [Candidatus Heimdallarchaeota archaeon]|nr:MAG: hypothetical protein JSW11_17860 [Candidatus Heimdallarchaeota archaeon]
MFIRIITVPAREIAFENLESIRKTLVEENYRALKEQKGWKKTVVMYNQEKKQFKVITYWSSKEQAGVLDERDPELSSSAYIQVGKHAEYFENENLTVEHYDHLETIENT